MQNDEILLWCNFALLVLRLCHEASLIHLNSRITLLAEVEEYSFNRPPLHAAVFDMNKHPNFRRCSCLALRRKYA